MQKFLWWWSSVGRWPLHFGVAGESSLWLVIKHRDVKWEGIHPFKSFGPWWLVSKAVILQSRRLDSEKRVWKGSSCLVCTQACSELWSFHTYRECCQNSAISKFLFGNFWNEPRNKGVWTYIEGLFQNPVKFMGSLEDIRASLQAVGRRSSPCFLLVSDTFLIYCRYSAVATLCF